MISGTEHNIVATTGHRPMRCEECRQPFKPISRIGICAKCIDDLFEEGDRIRQDAQTEKEDESWEPEA